MRLAEAGPWWDIAGATAVQDNHEELAVPERRLAKRTASGCVFNSTAPAQLTRHGSRSTGSPSRATPARCSTSPSTRPADEGTGAAASGHEGDGGSPLAGRNSVGRYASRQVQAHSNPLAGAAGAAGGVCLV